MIDLNLYYWCSVIKTDLKKVETTVKNNICSVDFSKVLIFAQIWLNNSMVLFASLPFQAMCIMSDAPTLPGVADFPAN